MAALRALLSAVACGTWAGLAVEGTIPPLLGLGLTAFFAGAFGVNLVTYAKEGS